MRNHHAVMLLATLVLASACSESPYSGTPEAPSLPSASSEAARAPEANLEGLGAPEFQDLTQFPEAVNATLSSIERKAFSAKDAVATEVAGLASQGESLLSTAQAKLETLPEGIRAQMQALLKSLDGQVQELRELATRGETVTEADWETFKFTLKNQLLSVAGSFTALRGIL